MKSLAHAPQNSESFVDETVEFDGETYEFSIRVLGFSEVGDLFKTTEGEHQNSALLAKLIVFRDDEGKVVPLSYEAACRLPPKLGVALNNKVLDANGLGDNSAKN